MASLKHEWLTTMQYLPFVHGEKFLDSRVQTIQYKYLKMPSGHKIYTILQSYNQMPIMFKCDGSAICELGDVTGQFQNPVKLKKGESIIAFYDWFHEELYYGWTETKKEFSMRHGKDFSYVMFTMPNTPEKLLGAYLYTMYYIGTTIGFRVSPVQKMYSKVDIFFEGTRSSVFWRKNIKKF
jgi:hypothetical protein